MTSDEDIGRRTKRLASRRGLLKATAGGLLGVYGLGVADIGRSIHGSGDGVTEAWATDALVDGPVLLTTNEMLETANRRIVDRRDPWYTAWVRTKHRADAHLDVDFSPSQGTSAGAYFHDGMHQAGITLSLAVSHALTADETYAAKAREILLEWATDPNQDRDVATSSSRLAQGLLIARVVSKFAYAATFIWHTLSKRDREAVEDWLGRMAYLIYKTQWIWHENDYFHRQYYTNHQAAHIMGLGTIGFVLDDRRIVDYALDSPRNPRDLTDMIEGAILMEGQDPWWADPSESDVTHALYDSIAADPAPDPQTGEMFDRYRVLDGFGMAYSLSNLLHLTVLAEAAYHNGYGRAFYDYTGPGGEHLELPFEYYAAFVRTGDTSLKSGYYAGEFVLEPERKALYELAHRRYPENDEIRGVLAANRVFWERENFEWTAVLTHGLDDLPTVPDRSTRSWSFDTDGDWERWRALLSVKGEVADGSLSLRLHDPDTYMRDNRVPFFPIGVAEKRRFDPSILSPDNLHVDADTYDTVVVRMKNNTEDTEAALYFRRADEKPVRPWPAYKTEHSVPFAIVPNDLEFRDYVVPVGENPEWHGTIARLQLDPAENVRSGTVDIDSIELAQSDLL